MRLFDSVTVACDHSPEMMEMAHALRSMMECLGLRVDFHHLIQKRQVLAFFARPPDADYTLLVTHGDGGGQITFRVVDQQDGDYTKSEGWTDARFALTPETIPEVVLGQRGTLIVIACGGGRLPLASAFLEAGYGAYVGADAEYYDADSAVLFVTSLFYHLLAGDRDYAPCGYSLEEAVARAAGADADFDLGTRVFRCWRPSETADAEKEAGDCGRLSVTRVHILAADTGLQPHVLRAAAEHFGASVTVTWVGNSAQVVDYLSGRPPHEVIVLSFHGDERGLVLPTLAEECRSLFPYFDVIRPEDFAQFLNLAGSVVLNNACLGGTPSMAEAFVAGGAGAYIGAEESPDTAASTKYVLDFLYAFLIQYPGDAERSHQAARNAEDDRGMFSLSTAS